MKLFYALLAGIFFGFSFIDVGFGFLAFFAFLPYFLMINKCKNVKQSFLYGLIFGLVLSLITLHPIILVKTIAFIGIMIAFPIYLAILSVLFKIINIRFPRSYYWFFPFIWIGFEFFMTIGPLNFPWFNIGYSLTKYYHLIQFADIFGIYGISFNIIIVNILIYKLLAKNYKSLFILLLVFLLWFGYGIIRNRNLKLKKVDFKIGIIQLSILQENKWKPEFLEPTVAEYANQVSILSKSKDPDLIILPESAITTNVLHDQEYKEKISEMARKNHVNIVTGFPDYERELVNGIIEYKYFNSATLIDTNGYFQDKYDKIKLVPFGERIPLLKTFPILENLQFGQANFEYGKNKILYKINRIKFPILICFEGVFPSLARVYAKRGADFIIVITNDGWFKRSIFPNEHANNTLIRSIETRTTLFRAANTGISYVADPKGRIINKTNLYEKKNISNYLIIKENSKSKTIFVKFGYLLPVFCFWFSIILIIYSFLTNIMMIKK